MKAPPPSPLTLHTALIKASPFTHTAQQPPSPLNLKSSIAALKACLKAFSPCNCCRCVCLSVSGCCNVAASTSCGKMWLQQKGARLSEQQLLDFVWYVLQAMASATAQMQLGGWLAKRTSELASGLVGTCHSLRHGLILRLARDARILDEAREGRVGLQGVGQVRQVRLHLSCVKSTIHNKNSSALALGRFLHQSPGACNLECTSTLANVAWSIAIGNSCIPHYAKAASPRSTALSLTA